ILDVMMPDMDGYEVCRTMRADSRLSEIPILFLTAKIKDEDRVNGFLAGADDYLTKPFNPRELVARVRAVLRRTWPDESLPADKVRRLGDVIVDPGRYEVTAAGQRINLRTKEFDLLLTMIDYPNMVLSRENLLDLAWGYEYYGATRTVDVHIAQLREKLKGSNLRIETVWGKGYKLVAEG
ncbi:MAG TPA: DNA-binding response regulator, partial [Chloroflexi bacterium]|nr:DNA-binding response regulator [Chloroflexota bacterium]